MNELNRCRFAELDAIQVDGVLETIVAVAREQQLWPHVLPLVPCLPEPAMARLGSIVSGLELTDEETGRPDRAARVSGSRSAQRTLMRQALCQGFRDRWRKS